MASSRPGNESETSCYLYTNISVILTLIYSIQGSLVKRVMQKYPGHVLPGWRYPGTLLYDGGEGKELEVLGMSVPGCRDPDGCARWASIYAEQMATLLPRAQQLHEDFLKRLPCGISGWSISPHTAERQSLRPLVMQNLKQSSNVARQVRYPLNTGVGGCWSLERPTRDATRQSCRRAGLACDEILMPGGTTVTLVVRAGPNQPRLLVLIHHFPTYLCQRCGKMAYHGSEQAALARDLEARVQRGEQLPAEMDFSPPVAA
jgi:hypothetical protein